MEGVSVQFVCKCKKTKGWIEDSKETLPCPKCGRKYVGVDSRRKLTIIAKEIGFFSRLIQRLKRK
jgi:Zn finger protein HypA/HybF involved in hydrogenase expression